VSTPETGLEPVAISASDISKSYSRDGELVHALWPMDFRVRAGDIVVILGPSGSGKSTFLNILSGLTRPTTGTVNFGERCLNQLRPSELALLRRFKMGFVFQQFYLLQHLTATENVMVPLGFQTGLSLASQRSRARDLLASVGLGHRLDHMPGELSGGEQQRVAIARALANDPAIVFADEPTGNLDRRSTEMVMALLEDLNEALTTTVVAVTHDPVFAKVAHRVLEIDDGEIRSDNRREGEETP